MKISSNAEDKIVSVNMPVFKRLHFVFILVGSYLTRSHFYYRIVFTFSLRALLNTTNHWERFFLLCWFGSSFCWVLPLSNYSEKKYCWAQKFYKLFKQKWLACVFERQFFKLKKASSTLIEFNLSDSMKCCFSLMH